MNPSAKPAAKPKREPNRTGLIASFARAA
jgi:hypothetical protein